jgi:hypothetical protein
MERSLGERKNELKARIKDFSAKSWEPRSALGDLCNETGLEMMEKRFLSGEEQVFSRRQARGWRREEKCQMTKVRG